jgi:hypothetical protein
MLEGEPVEASSMPPSQRCIVFAIEERWLPITVRAMALVCC